VLCTEDCSTICCSSRLISSMIVHETLLHCICTREESK
jgi:hypothetical protein